jgi:hypothetical protein
MGQGEKTGLELGGSEINAVAATEIEKRFERLQIGPLGICKILYWFRCKIETEHGSDPMENQVAIPEDLADTPFKVRAKLLKATIAIPFFKFAQLG